ncbi:hypothetical protein DH2020_032555 [Rehmannia glutinosa]|uniref:Uncharacterized protein n=1 Tax=Rehmannia glutinosa TaxID=99300 RepID=A0ABR0VIL0_REHGL
MRDLNEDSSSSSWPLFYVDRTVPNGQYYNGFMPRSSVDGYPGHDKDALKQKMLEHEAVFKNQVCELHRLYRIQRDMMQDVKRKELHKNRASMEPASSSSLQGSEEARKWHMAGFPLLNSSYARKSISGVEIINSPMSCVKANTTQSFQNGPTSKDSEGPRPLKVRKKLFDLQLPADEYIDFQEGHNLQEYKESDPNSGPENSMKLLHGASASVSRLRGSIGLADLNEPIQVEDEMAPSSVDFLGHTENVETKGIDQHAKPNGGYLGVTGETVHPLRTYTFSVPGSYPFVSSSSFATSWAHSVSSWAKPTSSFAQKSTSNGFYHASASGSSKDVQLHLPSTGLDYLNCSRGDNLASDRSTNHGFGIFPKGSCHAGLKPAIDINLNEVLSKSLQDEIAVPQDLNMTYGKSKPDDHLSALPWLKPKPIHVNCEITKKEEISETRTVKKILGVPIFERCVPENEPSPLASTSASIDCHPEGKIVSNERKNGFIDINVACEPDEQIAEEEPTVEKEKPKRASPSETTT